MAKSRVSFRFLVVTLILALIPGSALWTLMRGGPLHRETTLVVRKGATLDQIAQQMEHQGIIRSAALFRVWARTRKLQLIRGEYAFAPGTSLAAVAGKLKRGEIHYTNVVLVPGMAAWNVQRRLKGFIPEEVFWTLWKSPRLARAAGFPGAESLEGLLAPATYRLHHALEPEEIMLMMVETFQGRVEPNLEGGVLSPYDTLKLASLVEKETSLPEELPKVAGVYYHRLRIGMRLQCDPTSQYARWMTGDLRFTAPTSEDIRRPHRFNTYSREGLPPTPIAIPGPLAIEAAKSPDVSGDLYFVATGHGGHRFAPTFKDHHKNVAAFRRELKRR